MTRGRWGSPARRRGPSRISRRLEQGCAHVADSRPQAHSARFAECLPRAAFGPRELCYVRRSGAPRGPLSPVSNPDLRSRRPFRAPVNDDDLPHAWRRIRSEMRRAAGDTTWQLWLEPLTARELDAGTLVVETPAESRAWVEASFARLIAACAKAVLGAARAGAPRRSRRGACPRSGAPDVAQLHGRRVQPAPHVRPVRDRRRQPPRPRRRARRGRDARPGLQPALHLRAARARQDAPPALDRELRDRARRRAERALHDRRGLHGPVRRRAPRARARGLQGDLPRRRRAARGRRPVPAEQGPHRAGVLPHLQRAPGRRRAARAHVGPPAARPRRARGPPARALRGRPRDRRQAARPRDPPHHPLQARPAGRARSTSTRRPST